MLNISNYFLRKKNIILDNIRIIDASIGKLEESLALHEPMYIRIVRERLKGLKQNRARQAALFKWLRFF